MNRRAAVPHRVTVDDSYREHDIPVGCMMIPNVWSVMRALRVHSSTHSSPLQGDVSGH